MAAERVFLQRLLHQRGEAVEALPHVGDAQRHMHLHVRRHDHHERISRSATVRRTSSGSASIGANTRRPSRSEEHTSELQSLMRISYAVFCLKKKKQEEYTQ